MNNLSLLTNLTQFHCSIVNSKIFTLGNDSDSNICVFCLNNSVIYKVSLANRACDQFYKLHDYYPTEKVPEVVSVSYNAIDASILLAIENGDVISVDLLPKATGLLAITVDSGLKLMEWSPDQEIVVFLSGENTVIVMSAIFDLINETSLFDGDIGETQMISVGWGKKETQFHGSAGKEAATAVVESEDNTLIQDDGVTRISWRGDSCMFAVSFLHPKSETRKIKVFSREGILQCTSEDMPGLESPIAWRPSGNIIALTQRFPNKHVVCFMEKNGLRHGEFCLPDDLQVKQLSWSTDSTILCVQCMEWEGGRASDVLLLWTCSNYRWYLKQRLVMPGSVELAWNGMAGSHLVAFCPTEGRIFEYQWATTVDQAAATVAVIDARQLLVTSFKQAVIPPPMCSWTLNFPSAVQQVVFAPYPDGTHDDSSLNGDSLVGLLAVLCEGKVAVVASVDRSHVIQDVLSIEWAPESNSGLRTCELPVFLHHWLWLTQTVIACVASHPDGPSIVCHLELANGHLTVVHTVEMAGTVFAVCRQGQDAIIQCTAGRLSVYCSADRTLEPYLLLPALPEPCSKMANAAPTTGLIALSDRFRLYVDRRQVAGNVTTFLVHEPFLLLTTLHHSLVVRRLSSDGVCEEIASRRLERGSRLVTATGHSVILQLPRGNLETIEPRALTLRTVGWLLESRRYCAAFRLMRRQRIDLNLCVDHDSDAFLDAAGVKQFVSLLLHEDPSWLTLFVAELNDRDVTRGGFYAAYYDQGQRGPPIKNKTDRVCRALIETFDADDERVLPVRLSCLVKVGNTAEALELAVTERALRHLLCLTDIDTLYTAALGAYNLDTALRIAGKSQKDPKEYVPFLEELHKLDPCYRRYTIDRHLRRPHSALRHITQCAGAERFAECCTLVLEAGLYTQALTLLADNPDKYAVVAGLYGDHLLQQHHYLEAGLMYERSCSMAKAIDAYSRAGAWREAILLVQGSDPRSDELHVCCYRLYDMLRSRRLYAEAAELCAEWLSDVGATVECLVLARAWSQAAYLAVIHSRQDLIESHIKCALLEAADKAVEELLANTDVIIHLAERLAVVRQMKQQADCAFSCDLDVMSDVQSESSSASTFNTSITSGSRTSKNARKQQRKLWSLKEGNPREEQALLAAITQRIRDAEAMTGEVQSTCTALLRIRQDDAAARLQMTMKRTLDTIGRQKSVIWPPSVPGSSGDTDNTAALDAQLRFAPTSCVKAGWELEMLMGTNV